MIKIPKTIVKKTKTLTEKTKTLTEKIRDRLIESGSFCSFCSRPDDYCKCND